MQPGTRSASATPFKGALWAGRTMSGLAALLLLFDSGMKVMRAAPAVEGTVSLGYPENVVMPLGIVLLACVLAYAIPQTSVLGAILLTGFLGGAVATHVRHSDPLFSHILVPAYMGILIWGGLYLREPRLRALVPLRS